MPYSVVRDGKVLDITTKKLPNEARAVYLGDKLIGQAFNLRSGWSAVPAKWTPLGCVAGFKTMWKAYEFLLKIDGMDFPRPHSG